MNKVGTMEIDEKKELLEKAEAGDVESQYAIGLELATGDKPDYKLAIAWFEKAAEKDHVKSLCNLGYFYSQGEGVSVNQIKSIQYFRRAADLGYAPAQTNLAVSYERGLGVAIDKQEAKRWYKLAADQGLALAQFNYAIICYTATPAVHEEAFKYFSAAAESKLQDAQYSVGLCYSLGHGVEKDQAKAVFYYKLAADQGHPSGLHNLALHYYYGEGGIEVDKNEALKLFKLAAERGNANSAHAAKSLEEELGQQ